MFSERTILRINPTISTHPSNEGARLLGTCSIKVYQSCHDSEQGCCNGFDDQRSLVIEVEVNSDANDIQSTPTDPVEEINIDQLTEGLVSGHVVPFRPGMRDFDQRLLQTLGSEFRRISQHSNTDKQISFFREHLHELSPRELDVLILIMQGKTCKEVAAQLSVGLATVAKHRASIFKKLNVRNSTELIYLLNAVYIQRTSTACHGDMGRSLCSTDG